MPATDALPYTVTHPSRNVCVVNIEVRSWSELANISFLLRADAHHDNPDCNRDLEYSHLDQAIERNAGIIDAGDLFCAMQGKWDKRADKSKLRPEHQRTDYLDALVRTTADDYEKYARNWIVMGDGNHETAIKKHHETDLIERLTERLHERTGHRIQHGGYTGWVMFRFKRFTEYRTIRLWYAHGWGGGGQVTQNMIQAANRMLVHVGRADVVLTGHVHRRWAAEMQRAEVSEAGVAHTRNMWVVQCSTYKDEYKDGHGGWHVETGKGPRPQGGYWLEFYAGDRGPQPVVVPTR